jgi:excisionase family DNA binding protein
MSESETVPRPGEILTLAEAAEYLRIAEEKLADLAIDGGVPARRIGGEWRFLRKALDDWLRFSGRWDGSPLPRHWLLEASFAEELLALLEARLLHRLEAKTSKPGSKQAVLKHFGVFEGDEDLEQRFSDARARREAGG